MRRERIGVYRDCLAVLHNYEAMQAELPNSPLRTLFLESFGLKHALKMQIIVSQAFMAHNGPRRHYGE